MLRKDEDKEKGMTVAFIPLAERINPVGYTPDPNNPGRPELPEFPEPFERPFDWKPEIPEPGGALLVACKLNLKQGCYQIRMEHSGIVGLFKQPRFVGTMRVENGDDHTTISGDLYRFRPWRKPFFGRPDLTELFVDDAADDESPVIPIYARKRYYSYLKVVDIRRSLVTYLTRPCTITLTVEEYRYTHPEDGEVTGSFPETPNRVLTIVLRKAPNPEGYAGPSFEGTVFHGSRRLSYKFSMLWVSDFYRRARLELENVTGVAIPASAGANDFRAIYATAGWDVTVLNGDADLAVPNGVAAANPWSNAELHEFMLANRNPATNLDKDWQIYHVSVPFDSGSLPGLFGIMFDQLQDQREGACNFIQNFAGVHNDDRAKLRSAAHEVGHGFNLQHPPVEGLSSDNSIMSQSGPVRTLIEDSGGTYPDDVNFAFNEHNRHHLIHFPDVVVRPGGEDFQFGHAAGFAPEAEDNAAAAGLELHLKLDNNRLKLGEPLTLRIELKNKGEHTIRVPKNIGTAFHCAEVTVRKSGEKSRHFHSFVIACDSQDHEELKPGQSVGSDETIYWDRNGCIFQTPGMHAVSAAVSWDERGVPFSAKASAEVWVDYPVTDKDNHIASLLLDNEVGKYIALGGNAHHLKKAVPRIERATEVAKEHPAVQRILKINEAGKKSRPRR